MLTIVLTWDLSWSEVAKKVTLEARPERGVGLNQASREGGADEIVGTV